MRDFMRMMTVTLLAVMTCAVCSCKKDAPDTLDITGEWKLESADEFGDNVIVKSGEVIEISVYLSYASDGTFEIFQKLGEGRYRRYDGTYSVAGGIVTGKYSGGTSWGDSYSVSIENGNSLIMTASESKAVCVYSRTSVPSEVRSEAIDTKSASGNAMALGSRAVLP